MPEFTLAGDFTPKGDQPQAIAQLVDGVQRGLDRQVLLGVTGSGKTYTMASTVARLQRPTLVLAPNKTLAAQLAGEFQQFFPENAVEYFVSYYDYYQPEAYVPQSDTYIAKDASINDEIDKMRHAATTALFERRDVLIVASVSCLFGLGSPEDYRELCVSLRRGTERPRQKVLRQLVDNQYQRNDQNLTRGHFRVRGDVLEIFPAGSSERLVRVEYFGDTIERISELDALTGEVYGQRDHVAIYPASHYVTPIERREQAILTISEELRASIS
jgi:excinuclease ABC subunit B